MGNSCYFSVQIYSLQLLLKLLKKKADKAGLLKVVFSARERGQSDPNFPFIFLEELP